MSDSPPPSPPGDAVPPAAPDRGFRRQMVAAILIVLGVAFVRFWALPRLLPSPGDTVYEPALEERAATSAERTEAETSIRAQLDAFRRDDYRGAMRYQAETLRALYPTAEALRDMIRSNYPQLAHYQKAGFGVISASRTGRYLTATVDITGAQGVTANATYHLARENGWYRVTAVIGGDTPRRLPPQPRRRVRP